VTDPKNAPSRFVAGSHYGNFGRGPVIWAQPPWYASSSPRARARMRWLLCGAVIQHEYALAVAALVGAGKTYRTYGALADHWAWHPHTRLARLMRGSNVMAAADIAAALAVTGPPAAGPTARPSSPFDPSVLYRNVRTAIRSVPGGATVPPGALLRTTEEDVMDALRGSGYVIVQRAPTPEELAGHARTEAIAPALLMEAGRRLVRARLTPKHWDADGDNQIWALLAVPPGPQPAVVRGNPHPRGIDINAWLPADWAAAIHDRGLSVVDGWFVCAVTHPRPDGLPTIAVVLDLEPSEGVHGHDDDGEMLDNWEFATSRRRLVWNDGTPSLELL
jgi:hypothetical protein